MLEDKIKIYFIRHSKLDLPYKDHLEMPYEILDDLSTSRLDPSIAANSQELFIKAAKKIPLKNINFLYFNNSDFQSRRSRDSVLLIAKVLQEKYKREIPIIGNPNLKEVNFSVQKILSRDRFLKKGMPAVRTALYQAMINNGPVEQIAEVYARIDSVFESLNKHQEKNQTVLLVTHDFYMRVIEVYITKSKDYKEITVKDLENTTLNKYFKGFGVSYDLKLFKRL